MAEYIIDCKGKTLGRAASEIASILQGKKSVSYDPRLVGDDTVLVKHIDDLHVTGKKEDTLKYYSHTTQVGHLKEATYAQLVKKHGKKEALSRCVRGMLPGNKLRKERMKHLIFESN